MAPPLRPPVRLLRVTTRLPHGFATLRAQAAQEGFRFIDRLADGWSAGGTRFDRPGEALLAARAHGSLAAIGGLTLDPALAGALRMRRFYVRPAFRRLGIARLLAAALADQARPFGLVLTVNAGTPDAAAFWEAIGFAPHAQDGHTHILWRPFPQAPGAALRHDDVT
jgi:GNAT superfamily N-acetyltransferase